MARQGQRSQFGDPRESLTHLTAQLTFHDSVHGVHAAKLFRLSVLGVMFWLGISRARSWWLAKDHSCDQHMTGSPDHCDSRTEHNDRTLLYFGGAFAVNMQSLLRRACSHVPKLLRIH